MGILFEVLFLLPTLVSLGGLIFFLHQAGRGVLQRMLAFLFLLIMICSLCGFCSADHGIIDKWTVITDLLAWILGPVILAFIICLFYCRYHQTRLPWNMYLWFVIPVVFGSVLSFLVRLTGIDQMWSCLQACDCNAHALPKEYAAQTLFGLHRKMVTTQFFLILGVYIVVALAYGCLILKRTGYTWGEGHAFNFRGATMPPLHILVFAFFQIFALLLIYIVLDRSINDYPILHAFLSLMLACCLGEVIFAGRCVDYEEVNVRQLYGFAPIEFSYPMEEGFEDMVLVMPMEAKDKDLEERLQSGLDRVMDQQHVFRQCGLKIEEVARMIGTNRLYLSRYINEKYQMNFNEYLNHKRVEYAKEYMKAYRHDLQDRVACECGFISAQAFSRKFKEIEGVTPRIWVAELEKT